MGKALAKYRVNALPFFVAATSELGGRRALFGACEMGVFIPPEGFRSFLRAFGELFLQFQCCLYIFAP